MKLRWTLALPGLAAFALTALPASAAAAPAPFTVTAVVQDQRCVNGDTVRVTLSATTDSATPLMYRWDRNGDRRPDTAARSNPMTVAFHGDERTVTAHVGAMDANSNRAFDGITFATMRCSGGGR